MNMNVYKGKILTHLNAQRQRNINILLKEKEIENKGEKHMMLNLYIFIQGKHLINIES